MRLVYTGVWGYRVHAELVTPSLGYWYLHSPTDVSAKWFWGVLRLQLVVLGLGVEIHITPPGVREIV